MIDFLLLNVHGGEKAYTEGTGTSGEGGQKSETSKQAPTQKTKATVDCRQNNSDHSTKAIAVPSAMQNSHDYVHSSAIGKQLKQKSNSLAQHHLPALDLFWASFSVLESPAHLPSLDLAWTLSVADASLGLLFFIAVSCVRRGPLMFSSELLF